MIIQLLQEANATFGHSITDMMNEFIEQAQAFFVQLRDSECNFCDIMQEATNRYVTYKLTSNLQHTVPEELKECLEDKESILNLVSGMRDHHMYVIDSREDRLMTRGRGWVKNLISNLQK